MYSIDRGQASIYPAGPVEAGSFVTVVYTYTAGHPIDDGGRIKIVFRQVGDFGIPQFADSAKPNYYTISTTGDCTVEASWDPRGHARPWVPALVIRVTKGFLDRGESIKIVFGDRSGGSDGWRMQTFCEESFELRTLVDPIAKSDFKDIQESPTLKVISGKPVHAVCIAPSEVGVSQAFNYYLKLEDRWGNPTGQPVSISHPGFSSSGLQSIVTEDKETGLLARSNPIDIVLSTDKLHPYWADFHGQSEETVGTNTIDDYFAFARDYALLDICGHQGNDFEVSDDFWQTINDTTKRFYQNDKFVTFPGYEWSGNTPMGGDRNVYFVSEGGRISRSSSESLADSKSRDDDRPTATDLFDNLKGQSVKSFAFAHVGGRYADITMHDEDIEVAVEVHSAWGTFEWLVADALKMGYRIGICANSDGHKGRPGASYPGARTFGSLGGLTCVLAQSLDRQSVYEAMKSRHFYATTGNRALIDLVLVAADGHVAMMGDVIQIDSGVPTLKVAVAGTGPIESVQVRNGSNVVKTMRPYDLSGLGRRIKIVWAGAEVKGRARVVNWDGRLQLTGNSIVSASSVNFWNDDLRPVICGEDRLEWKSSTTGGIAGVIVELARSDTGSVRIETAQRTVELDIASIGLDPTTYDCGGVEKRLEVYHLPDEPCASSFAFDLPLTDLYAGDNPIYIRTSQEDGHMAWTSPAYVVRS
ncbi:MAG: DUF3604 domain-containing protein [Chloroflexi bacterium]|nr:DUF3604 domain-containing protein [Chloroflexota bacterium]MBT7081491.1 DUF3604 domain-containing protein [Chloroflexota bacterium]MBT7290699.1 DUF3604 domain-containing protein [Chloroflexota bacterium]